MKNLRFVLITFLATPAFAVTDAEFADLMGRVVRLETRSGDSCIARADGHVFARKSIYWEWSGGKWSSTNGWLTQDFEFQIRKEFRTADGTVLLAVRLSAPGYDKPCVTHTFEKSRVFLY